MTTANTPDRPGWFDDPEAPGQLRYFDGILWTDNTTARSTPVRREAPAQPTVSPIDPTTPPAPPRPLSTPAELVGPGAVAADGTPLASYGRRVGAFLIDGVIKIILNTIFGGWAVYLAWRDEFESYFAAVEAGKINPTPPAFTLATADYRWLSAYALVTAFVGLVYSVAFLVWRGATPGKMAVGIQVRPVGSTAKVTVSQAVRRYAISFANSALSFDAVPSLFTRPLWVLDHLLPLWDSKRQALHDKLANTEVVLVRPQRQRSAPDSYLADDAGPK